MSATALLQLCSTWRREIDELEELSEQGVELTPRLRALRGQRQALLNDISKALADRDNPERSTRARATFLPELNAEDDGAGKLLIVVTADELGSGLVTSSNEIGEQARGLGTANRVVASAPLALVTDAELRAIRIKEPRRVLVLRRGWDDKLHDALTTAGARYPHETTTAVVRACRSEKILSRWLKGTRDARHLATLRDQLGRVTKRRVEAAE
jgi:hypothetical protein